MVGSNKVFSFAATGFAIFLELDQNHPISLTHTRSNIMRMMMKVSMPVETANVAIKSGNLSRTVMNFVEIAKPESSYFTTENGKRTGFFYFNMTDSNLMPTYAEPFFMNLNAEVTWYPVMDLSDLKSGIEKASKFF